MTTVRHISEKQIAANRANAQQSTGPRTEAGKRASRMNAVTHGLLAQAVPITKGDYKENPREFAQLLEGLRHEFTPVGVAEDLEVQTLARCYWRKRRAARCEHGAIRQRTADMRVRDAYRRDDSLEHLLAIGDDLERSSRGIECLLEKLDGAKQELRGGTLAGTCFTWLTDRYPDHFPLPDETQMTQEGDRRVVTAAYRDQIVATIDEHLGELEALHVQVAAREARTLESEIHAAALPEPEVVDKLIRYETANDRELDRALRRLEAMQARRRKEGDAPADQ